MLERFIALFSTLKFDTTSHYHKVIVRVRSFTTSHSPILDDHVLCSCEPGKPCSYGNRGWCYLVGGPLAESCAGATKGSDRFDGYWTRDEEICQRDDGKR